MITTRIHQLDNILANQIAAGEVVERPASVVKELLENAIDAGATRIDIEVEKGGASLIRVKDDGSGIHPEDLTLALSRHATSKIKKTEDLAAITSLGFRGEALASISSVSKLDLTSKWKNAEQAFTAEAHGRDMQVSISPAGLNQGTLVEVRELFFNTPARRRFMRTDKTEFRNIDTVVTRIALSHPHISFLLKHNGKKVRQFIAAENRQSQELRVGQILGKEFMQNCVHFALQHQVESAYIKFNGWLGLPSHHRSMNDGQFVFINKRAVKDKVVSHAIREAYADLIPQGRLPAYIINIEMDEKTVDVNVHPTKHEVRFQHQRMVHDLIIRAIAEVLSETSKETGSEIKNRSESNTINNDCFDENSFDTHSYFKEDDSENCISESAENYGNFIKGSHVNEQQPSLVIDEQFLILPVFGKLLLVSFEQYLLNYWPKIWKQKIETSCLDVSPILFPSSFELNQQQESFLIENKIVLERVGFKFHLENINKKAKLLSVPNFMAGIDTIKICEAVLILANEKDFIIRFSEFLAKDPKIWQSIINYHNLQEIDGGLKWLSLQVDINSAEILKENSSWIQIITTDLLRTYFSDDSDSQ